MSLFKHALRGEDSVAFYVPLLEYPRRLVVRDRAAGRTGATKAHAASVRSVS